MARIGTKTASIVPNPANYSYIKTYMNYWLELEQDSVNSSESYNLLIHGNIFELFARIRTKAASIVPNTATYSYIETYLNYWLDSE